MATSPRVVIIGAGVVGCALADELTERGWHDVTVVDQGPLSSPGGSSSHATGPVFQTNGSKAMAGLAAATVAKLSRLELDGQPCFDGVGDLEVATTPERLAELHRRHGWNTSWGIESAVVDAQECLRLHPLLDLPWCSAACTCPATRSPASRPVAGQTARGLPPPTCRPRTAAPRPVPGCRSCATRTRTCTSASTATGSASAPTATARCRWTPVSCSLRTTPRRCRRCCPSPRRTSPLAGVRASCCCRPWPTRRSRRGSTGSSPSPRTAPRCSASTVTCQASGSPRRCGSPTPPGWPRRWRGGWSRGRRASTCTNATCTASSDASPSGATASRWGTSPAPGQGTPSVAASPTPGCSRPPQVGTAVTIDWFGRRLGATVAAEPLADPTMERIRR